MRNLLDPAPEAFEQVVTRNRNVLFLMSDEHSREIAGCYGNSIVRTPNLDALAARGVVFENAYCNSPICVPSRASLATGDYVHRIGYWDSAAAYDGRVPSWHHRVRDAGHDVVSIGKLHYRSPDDDCGFTEVHLPLYVVDGIGDTHGLLRRDRRVREVARELAEEAGRGTSVYTRYDTAVADATVHWIRERAKRRDGGKPWVLFSSMVSPHYPLIAPDAFYDLYAGVELPRPRLYDPADRPNHPAIDHYRATWNYDDHFDEERLRVGLTAYYGLCSFLDFQIGRILAALEESGFADDTLVIYTSDHGENLGSRGLWGKCVMYEESSGVPLLLAGPGVGAGTRCPAPVSLVDIYPTVVEFACGELDARERALPGENLVALAREPPEGRVVFSEMHDDGSMTGTCMVRRGDWKLVHYVGHAPQLFNLAADPIEAHDLAGRPETSEIQRRLYDELHRIVDPDAANRRAFADQEARIERLGGVEAILARPDFNFTPLPAA